MAPGNDAPRSTLEVAHNAPSAAPAEDVATAAAGALETGTDALDRMEVGGVELSDQQVSVIRNLAGLGQDVAVASPAWKAGIKVLQQRINEVLGTVDGGRRGSVTQLTEDGNFGPKTEKALGILERFGTQAEKEEMVAYRLDLNSPEADSRLAELDQQRSRTLARDIVAIGLTGTKAKLSSRIYSSYYNGKSQKEERFSVKPGSEVTITSVDENKGTVTFPLQNPDGNIFYKTVPASSLDTPELRADIDIAKTMKLDELRVGTLHYKKGDVVRLADDNYKGVVRVDKVQDDGFVVVTTPEGEYVRVLADNLLRGEEEVVDLYRTRTMAAKHKQIKESVAREEKAQQEQQRDATLAVQNKEAAKIAKVQDAETKKENITAEEAMAVAKIVMPALPAGFDPRQITKASPAAQRIWVESVRTLQANLGFQNPDGILGDKTLGRLKDQLVKADDAAFLAKYRRRIDDDAYYAIIKDSKEKGGKVIVDSPPPSSDAVA